MTRRPPSRAFAALALTVTLSAATGCTTVHGEREVVPAASRAEAAKALKAYTAAYNKANRALDPSLNAAYETGALGAMDQAGLKARRITDPGGNPGYVPLELTDARYAIPRQAGWPKWFVADTDSNRDGNRWLFVFTRGGPDERWKAAYLSLLSPEEVPRFATDPEGHAEPVPASSRSGLVLAPKEVSGAYAAYLETGEGPFAEGFATTEQLDARKKRLRTPTFWTQYADQAAQAPRYAPVALRTRDGGALVFFAAHHTQKQTMAEGFRIKGIDDPKVNALMTGEAKRTLTLVRISGSAVTVPARGEGGGGDGEIVFLNRLEGLTDARGG